MSNVLSDHRKQQVIALGRLGWSLRRIEQETGVRRETASTYLKAAGISVASPGRRSRQGPAKPAIPVTPDPELGKPASQKAADGNLSKPAIPVTPDPELGKPANQEAADGNPSKPAIPVTPDFGAGPAAPPASLSDANRSPSASACEPFREAIELGLRLGRNAKGIWQDLVSQVGFPGSYQTVKRFVRKLRAGQTKEACGVIVTPPGEEAQVDYGRGPLVRDPKTGKYRHTRLFVMTLGYSRKAVRLLTFYSSTRIWAELHEQAFRRLGGSLQVMVLDNLAEGVLKPDIYDPTLNPLYRDVLAHYHVIALPCRVNDPDRKDHASYCTSLHTFDARCG
jgi:transposase